MRCAHQTATDYVSGETRQCARAGEYEHEGDRFCWQHTPKAARRAPRENRRRIACTIYLEPFYEEAMRALSRRTGIPAQTFYRRFIADAIDRRPIAQGHADFIGDTLARAGIITPKKKGTDEHGQADED